MWQAQDVSLGIILVKEPDMVMLKLDNLVMYKNLDYCTTRKLVFIT